MLAEFDVGGARSTARLKPEQCVPGRIAERNFGTDLKPAQLDRICTKVVPFTELPAQFDDYLKGRVTGRAVVRIA